MKNRDYCIIERVYYGWRVLAVASLAMVATLPGRTQGLGLITEPMLADLGLARLTYAEINLWATLIGSAGAIGVGQLLDRFGSRAVLTVVAVLLGLVVVGMSQAQAVGTLAVAITLTRTFGQSALSVVSLAMIAPWFVRRIDRAMAIYSIALSIGFMAAFPIVGGLVQQRGWRTAWLAVGVTILIVLAPAAWLVVRRSPASMGVAGDEEHGSTGTQEHGSDATWGAALSTPAFWVFAIGTSLYGLVASGIGLFNESILAERGFGAEIYYQTLVVTAMTALLGNFLGGWLAAYARLTRLMAAALAVLAVGLVVLPHVTSVAQVMAWATAMGLGGGLVTVLFFSVWPRFFGRRHIGRIQGSAQAMTVVFSAVGPLLLAWCVTVTGSYAAMFYLLSALVGVLAALAVVTPLPASARAAA